LNAEGKGVFFMECREIKDLLASGNLCVSVYGLGGVGLAITAVWLRAGARVIGVDINDSKVDHLNEGIVDHPEIVVKETIQKAVREGRFKATTDGVNASKNSDIKIVIVPLLLTKSKEPDFTAIDSAVTSIARGLKRGDMVIIETSLPPGTTMYRIKPLLESIGGLKAEEDFGLAYSPERVMVGHAVRDIEEAYPKIVGGVGPRSSEVAKALYERIAKRGVIVVSNPTVAEFEKLAEGIYRDVNIALANELARLAQKLGVDYEEVKIAANSQPYCHLHDTGSGVGGYCIPVYPYLMLYSAVSNGIPLELTITARRINEEQPEYVVKLILDVIKELKLNYNDVKIAILGLAFRGDIGDSRVTPVHDILRGLAKSGIKNIVVHDPFVKNDIVVGELGLKLTSDLSEAVKDADIVAILTKHSLYRKLTAEYLRDLSGKDRICVVDAVHALNPKFTPKGSLYVGVGRPLVKVE